ncbi:PLAC8 family-domain-containing protein [Gymnopilus junonius]|uniref:PLAC8 family-domain-containing protein n=1 Tax=Gymnopilus junonius TaxID=109634 RepID=A0A9P5NLQ2_GYMJU|nr:PLAC8 family-domain-containing protein [Gymnopilus junonius]
MKTTTRKKTAKNPKGLPFDSEGRREWSSDLCAFCDDNLGTCCNALWCPCMVYAGNKARVEYLDEKDGVLPDEERGTCSGDCWIHGLLTVFTGCVGGWVLQIPTRTSIRHRYAIAGDGLDDCCAVMCCCAPCALAQERREIELEEGWRKRRRGR